MIKLIFQILKYTFENGPNAAFWVAILVVCFGWYTQQNLIIRLVFIIVPIFGLVLFFRKAYKDAKRSILTRGANLSVGKSVQTSNADKVKDLIKSIPTNVSLKSLYGYAEEYAKNWASDGILGHVNFYISLKGDVITKRAQIFLHSPMRNEQLTTYFPAMSDNIEELDISTIPRFLSNSKAIYEYDKWRESLRNAIESSSSDIAKASEIDIQIATGSSLDFRFSFKLDNRTWKRHVPHKKV